MQFVRDIQEQKKNRKSQMNSKEKKKPYQIRQYVLIK